MGPERGRFLYHYQSSSHQNTISSSSSSNTQAQCLHRTPAVRHTGTPPLSRFEDVGPWLRSPYRRCTDAISFSLLLLLLLSAQAFISPRRHRRPSPAAVASV